MTGFVEIVRDITGREPDSDSYLAYLENKYGELYGLYLTAVVMIFVFSYLVPDHWINHVHDGDTVTGPG